MLGNDGPSGAWARHVLKDIQLPKTAGVFHYSVTPHSDASVFHNSLFREPFALPYLVAAVGIFRDESDELPGPSMGAASVILHIDRAAISQGGRVLEIDARAEAIPGTIRELSSEVEDSLSQKDAREYAAQVADLHNQPV
jgi:hypothetical protein